MKQLKVVYLDDSSQDREDFVRLMEKTGLVCCYATGAQADALKELRRGCDVFVVDIELDSHAKSRDGEVLARQLRICHSELDKTAVVVFSGYLDREGAAKATEQYWSAGLFYLEKSAHPARQVASIYQAALRWRGEMSPAQRKLLSKSGS